MKILNPAVLLCFLIIIPATAQKPSENQPSVQQDTIRKVVEVVRYEYEYYDPEPIQLWIGTGIIFQNTKIKTSSFDASGNQPGIPLEVRLQKGRFYARSGFHFQNTSVSVPFSETIESIIEHLVTQTVVVDTFYRYNNGDPQAEIVTKEVEITEYETIEKDTTYQKKRDYSTYQIPLSIGYYHSFNKFSLRGDVGICLHFFTNNAWKYVTEDLSEADRSFYTYQVALGAGYTISKRWQLDCSIGFSQKTNSKAFELTGQNVGFRLFYKLF